MFYVSSKKGNLYGVTDTNDNVEEFYTPEQLKDFMSRGIFIDGASITIRGSVAVKRKYTRDETGTLPTSKEDSKFYTHVEEALLQHSVGTPLLVKLSKDLDIKQCIYLGKRDKGVSKDGHYLGEYIFFDGTFFALTSVLFYKHQDGLILDYNNNSPEEVTKLLKMLEKNK